MATFVSSVLLNGFSPFSFNGIPGSYQWSNGFLLSVPPFADDPGNSYDIQITQSGSWGIRDMSFAGASPKTITITDQDNANRFYDLLQFFDGASATLDFTATRAHSIRGFGGRYDFSLGASTFESVAFGTDQAVDLTLAADGRISRLTAFSPSGVGPRDITIAGRVELMRFNEGNNTITVAEGGRIEALRIFNEPASGATSTIAVNGRVDAMTLFDGPASVTVSGAGTGNSGNLGYLLTNGPLDLRLSGDARAQTLRLDATSAVIESESGNIGSLSGFASTATMRLGSGGINQLTLNGTGGVQDIAIDGFAGIINVMNDNQLLLTLGDGGAGMVRATATGNHRLAAGNGFVNSIQTGSGADTIFIGSGGVGFAHGGGGDDRFVFSRVDPDSVVRIAGGQGSDTADFRFMGFGVRVDLGDSGFQNIVASGSTTMAAVQIQNIENLIGSNRNDVLIGSGASNTLQGLDGDDVLVAVAGDNFLFGGAGLDRLVAGTGNDRMRGGPGADTFVFGDAHGFNTIRDYQRTLDRIEIVGDGTPASFADLTITPVAFGTRVDYGSTRILLENVFNASLITEANFDFV